MGDQHCAIHRRRDCDECHAAACRNALREIARLLGAHPDGRPADLVALVREEIAQREANADAHREALDGCQRLRRELRTERAWARTIEDASAISYARLQESLALLGEAMSTGLAECDRLRGEVTRLTAERDRACFDLHRVRDDRAESIAYLTGQRDEAYREQARERMLRDRAEADRREWSDRWHELVHALVEQQGGSAIVYDLTPAQREAHVGRSIVAKPLPGLKATKYTLAEREVDDV